VYGTGKSSNRRTTGENGDFELVSEDGQDAGHPGMSVDISSSRMVPSQTDGHSSQEFTYIFWRGRILLKRLLLR